MLVELRLGIAEMQVSTGSGFISLKAGQQIQLFGEVLSRLLQQNLVVKSEYKNFVNDEIIVIEHKDEIGFRPVGRKEKRV